MAIIGVIMIVIYGMLFEGFSFNMNAETGVFGFCD
jgi:hypothetical protein